MVDEDERRGDHDDQDNDLDVDDDDAKFDLYSEEAEWDEGGKSHCGYSETLHSALMSVGETVHKMVGDPSPQVEKELKAVGNWFQEASYAARDLLGGSNATGEEGGARVAKTVRHLAVQVPPSVESKRAVLEDIIAVEISKDVEIDAGEEAIAALEKHNPIAAAAALKKSKSNHAMQQKVFGKTIVFTETKREADELVSGGVFKSLTAQALHGDVGQKQRDATLNAFRSGAFNVLVATDVAARGYVINVF